MRFPKRTRPRRVATLVEYRVQRRRLRGGERSVVRHLRHRQFKRRSVRRPSVHADAKIFRRPDVQAFVQISAAHEHLVASVRVHARIVVRRVARNSRTIRHVHARTQHKQIRIAIQHVHRHVHVVLRAQRKFKIRVFVPPERSRRRKISIRRHRLVHRRRLRARALDHRHHRDERERERARLRHHSSR